MKLKGMLVAMTVLLFACSADQVQTGTAVEQWSQDIDSYRMQLEERHINLYHTVGREEFYAKLEKLKVALPDLNEQQILVELMRVTRLVGDGHTQLAIWDNDNGYFPFRLQRFDGEFRLVAAGEPHRHLLGRKLESIDGVPADELVSRLSPLVQGVENEHSLSVRLGEQIGVAQVLYGLGVIQQPERAAFTFSDDLGRLETVSVSPLSMGQYYKQVNQRLAQPPIPFGEKHLSVSDHLWLTADDKTDTAYLHFSGYPSKRQMEGFARKLRNHLDKSGTRNLIIDLRNNGGGDFFVGLLLAWGLVLVDGLDWDNGIYVLIGNRTYSAGMSNAAQYRQVLNAKLVGEPTGGNPVGYQDMDSFTLPNSGWRITYSKRNYSFQDEFSPGVQPDVLMEADWESYRRGIDRSLAWVMQDIAARRLRYDSISLD